MSVPKRRMYTAIVNNDERDPIEDIYAKDAAEARKKARRYMTDVAGWLRQDGKLSIKVRLAPPKHEQQEHQSNRDLDT